MSYKLIKGEFHVFYPTMPKQGPEPDGDTLKFKPDRKEFVEALHKPGSVSPRFNGLGMINLRFEGIDALETHFDQMHQHQVWADAARDGMLQRAGFGRVQFWPDLPHKVKAVQNHPLQGYVLSRGIDCFGRVIAFVYSGSSGRNSGANVYLDVPLLNQSLNAKLLSAGLVYPAFYSTLPMDLKDRLRVLAVQAWNASRGLWPDDTANPFNDEAVSGLGRLQTLALWPKLFRRLARYFAAGHTGLRDFDNWLRADPRDRDDRIQLPTGEIGNIHDVIQTRGNRIQMIFWPEDIVILPDDA